MSTREAGDATRDDGARTLGCSILFGKESSAVELCPEKGLRTIGTESSVSGQDQSEELSVASGGALSAMTICQPVSSTCLPAAVPRQQVG